MKAVYRLLLLLLLGIPCAQQDGAQLKADSWAESALYVAELICLTPRQQATYGVFTAFHGPHPLDSLNRLSLPDSAA